MGVGIVKVVYFDECSAVDYLDIVNEGRINSISEKTNTDEYKAAVKAGINLQSKLGWLSKLGVAPSINAGADLGYSHLGNKLIKNTISNTVLTDYIKAIDKNKSKSVRIFKGYKTFARENSLSWIKMYSPYLIMGKDDMLNDIPFDLTKLDEALSNAKGYYELLIDNSTEKHVLRFNIDSFRNNYNIADLVKMDLTYFAVKVGKVREENLAMENEFNISSNTIITARDMLNMEDTIEPDMLDVYDVVLSGVCIDEN